jgi:hypothetical protein
MWGRRDLPHLDSSLFPMLMPKVLEVNGFIFFFYSQEGNEPPHVHVRKGESSAKFWLNPFLLHKNYGFSSSQIKFITKTITENKDLLLDAWHEFFK